jgi:Na+/H+ antiporter NhaD/arsenite permease-like protein
VPAARASAWLAVAMASTLSGNLTPIASVATLVVIERARREGVEVTFGAYCRVGVPVTLVTLAAGLLWLGLAR